MTKRESEPASGIDNPFKVIEWFEFWSHISKKPQAVLLSSEVVQLLSPSLELCTFYFHSRESVSPTTLPVPERSCARSSWIITITFMGGCWLPKAGDLEAQCSQRILRIDGRLLQTTRLL